MSWSGRDCGRARVDVMATLDGGDVRRRHAAWSAYAAAGLFVVGLARFAVPQAGLGDGTVVGAIVAAAPHVVLLVGVWPALGVPRWASAAGLTWLLIDLTSDALALAGTSPATFLTVRYVGHLFGAAWIGRLALDARGATRAVGLLLAVLLGGYTLVAAWVPPFALAPSGPLLVAWWFLVGRGLSRPMLTG